MPAFIAHVSPRRVTGGYCIAHTVTRKYLRWWVISGNVEGMTTATMNTITITFWDNDPVTLNASYWRIEDGWITLKDSDHNPIAAFTERAVATIRSSAAHD